MRLPIRFLSLFLLLIPLATPASSLVEKPLSDEHTDKIVEILLKFDLQQLTILLKQTNQKIKEKGFEAECRKVLTKEKEYDNLTKLQPSNTNKVAYVYGSEESKQRFMKELKEFKEDKLLIQLIPHFIKVKKDDDLKKREKESASGFQEMQKKAKKAIKGGKQEKKSKKTSFQTMFREVFGTRKKKNTKTKQENTDEKQAAPLKEKGSINKSKKIEKKEQDRLAKEEEERQKEEERQNQLAAKQKQKQEEELKKREEERKKRKEEELKKKQEEERKKEQEKQEQDRLAKEEKERQAKKEKEEEELKKKQEEERKKEQERQNQLAAKQKKEEATTVTALTSKEDVSEALGISQDNQKGDSAKQSGMSNPTLLILTAIFIVTLATSMYLLSQWESNKNPFKKSKKRKQS